MKVTGPTTWPTGLELISTQMAALTEATGLMISSTALELKSGTMDRLTEARTPMDRKKERVNTSGLMETSI